MSDIPPKIPDLLQRIAEGDEEAVNELVQHYSDIIRVYVRVQLRRCAELRPVYDSLDFTQDVCASFVFALRNGHRFQSEEHLIAYLRRVARNKVGKVVRSRLGTAKHDRRREVPLDDRAAELVDPAPNFVETIANKELLDRAMQLLSHQDRAILWMKNHEKYSFREIGEKLGWTERAISRKIVQILNHLMASCRPPSQESLS